MKIRHITRKVHRAAVGAWHRHHGPTVGEIFALGAFVGEALVAVVVIGRPVAAAYSGSDTMEVTRLACGPDAPKFTASRLLGQAARVMDAAGATLQISYTRVDERGGCYFAANWAPVAYVDGRLHDTGNRSLRWLPGMHKPSTEVIDRVRWERGPSSPSAKPDVEWDGQCWKQQRRAA